MSHPNPLDRARQARRLARSEGRAGVAHRVRRRAARWLEPPGLAPLPVAREHLARASDIARSGWTPPPVVPADAGEPLTVAWVCAPPGGGSGGHTTMFRMVSALEQAGHRCIVYLDDRHGWSLAQHERTIRTWWPWVEADIRDAADGIDDAHAIFATAWQTAYTVLASSAHGTRFYFVQDFEPWFYPAGSEALLAEATYRFGFHGVTAGHWLSERLRRDYGMAADHFDFGFDLDRYGLDRSAGAQRTGVCFFSRPSTPRRAFALGVAALDLFAMRHPDVDLHLFGEPAGRLPFAATDHGTQSPQQLNDLYNRCLAGLVLSATNVSLVPNEMLAAGCIPIVNDADHNRVVLGDTRVSYAAPTPFALADALSEVIQPPAVKRLATAEAAATSVRGRSWRDAGLAVERTVRRVVGDRAPAAAARRAS